MMNENRMFSEMLKAAKARIMHKKPEGLARNAGVDFDGECFRFDCLGHAVEVRYPGYEVVSQMQDWFPLLVLHYLDTADGTPVSGSYITFAQQKDGMVRGGGFDRRTEGVIESIIGNLSPDELERRCLALGGRMVESNADFCADFLFFPRYPLRLQIWFADDEFPASGRLLTDSTAAHYLTIEDAVTLGEIFLELLLSEQPIL